MSTYRDIADSAVEAGAPVSQPLLQSLTDNQLAIPQGAQGAPKLKVSALALATSQAQTKDTAVFRAKFNVGDSQSNDSSGEDLYTDTYFLGRGGNFAVHIVTIGAGLGCKAQLRKNGSVIQTTTIGSGTVSTWYQLDFSPADKINVEFVPSGNLREDASVQVWIYTNTPFSASDHTFGFLTSYYTLNGTKIYGYVAQQILDTY
tara:strand:+ start:2234 stop:2842 length:609 start_codon:yes stop_codon:yes gene_type:complete